MYTFNQSTQRVCYDFRPDEVAHIQFQYFSTMTCRVLPLKLSTVLKYTYVSKTKEQGDQNLFTSQEEAREKSY